MTKEDIIQKLEKLSKHMYSDKTLNLNSYDKNKNYYKVSETTKECNKDSRYNNFTNYCENIELDESEIMYITKAIQAYQFDYCDSQDKVCDNGQEFNNHNINAFDLMEYDRKRISHELHDTTVQTLTMLIHKAELCKELINLDTNRTKLELHVMIANLKNAIDEIRETIFDLRPMSLDDLGLIPTVERFIIQLRKQVNKNILLRVNNIEFDLPEYKKLMIFRIIQEACVNACKHSNCNNIFVKIMFLKTEMIITVKDDGGGFTYCENNMGIDGYGITVMKERARIVNGDFSIDTDADGTTVTLTILNDKEYSGGQSEKD